MGIKSDARKAKKKSKGAILRERIAKRIALQEEDERLGRKAPPLPRSIPKEERMAKRERMEKAISPRSSMDLLDAGSMRPVNRQASHGMTAKPPRR